VALTATQAGAHGHAFETSGPGQNLFDANDVGERARAGIPINPQRRISWIAETDTACKAVRTAHNYDLHRAAEETFFFNEIARPFIAVAANRADLEAYDRFGF